MYVSVCGYQKRCRTCPRSEWGAQIQMGEEGILHKSWGGQWNHFDFFVSHSRPKTQLGFRFCNRDPQRTGTNSDVEGTVAWVGGWMGMWGRCLLPSPPPHRLRGPCPPTLLAKFRKSGPSVFFHGALASATATLRAGQES